MEHSPLVRSLRWLPVLAVAMVLTACAGTTTDGRAVAATTVPAATSPAGTTEPPAEPTDEPTPEPSTEPAAVTAPVAGRVDVIVVFTDPAEEITTARDLTDYVLPGIYGPGVDCVLDLLDPDDILAMSVPDGSEAVTTAVLDCVEPSSLGHIIAMYAVGLGDDGAAQYEPVTSCAADALAEESPDTLRDGFESIFDARLDLNAPPTSPDIAYAFLTDRTDCLTDVDPVPTPEETPAPSAPVEPPPSSQPDASVRWDLLRAGQCVVDLPDGDISEVTVTDCANPHESEVVGTDLPLAGTEQTTCDEKFAGYTGKPYTDVPDYVVEYLTGTDTFVNPQLICLATSASGEPTTGSLAA